MRSAQAESDAEEIRNPKMSFHCCRLTLLSLSLAMVFIPLADVNQGGDLLTEL